MQNPFVRLKHYRRDAVNPIENHATEILATCLSLSDNIKREFVSFLFDDKVPFDLAEVENLDVSTQQQLGGYGIVDLLLEAPGIRNIVVEVKVEAKEDGSQIQKYRDWVDQTKEGEKYVFSLVKRPSDFKIAAFGGDARRTWGKLYEWLRNRKKKLVEDSELRIVDQLCDYLGTEGIVINWQPRQIVNYGNGVFARKALRALFDQLGEQFENLDTQYVTKPVTDHENEWPRLEIGMKPWSAIFGAKGYLNKLYIYYETEAAWEGEAERFQFNIVLWNKWHRGDWRKTESQLDLWIPYLTSKGLTHWTQLKGARDLEGKGADEYKFIEPPAQIVALFADPRLAFLDQKDFGKMAADELIDKLFSRSIKHCEIISGLPHA
jgi:hypothetical protein